MRCAEAFDLSGEPDLPYVCGIQYDNEPSVRRNQCRLPAYRTIYSGLYFKTNSLFASDVGIEINGDAHIIMAPNIGSYVGGDITAGTLVSMIWNRPEFSLFIDLGTNGELVFGNSDFMMSCACSAGPAFEGGDISCGMRATDGAIEACTIDKKLWNRPLRS